MPELCQSVLNDFMNTSVTDDLNFSGRAPMTGEEKSDKENTQITGMTPASFRMVAELWVKDEFKRCDEEGCNGLLYPDHKPADVNSWRFMPPQIGSATYGNVIANAEDDGTVELHTDKAIAVGIPAGAVGGAVGGGLVALGFKLIATGTPVSVTPLGWGLILGGAVLVGIGGAVAGHFIGKRATPERDLVHAGLDKSMVQNWSFDMLRRSQEFVNLAQAGVLLRDANPAVRSYIDEVKKGFEEYGKEKWVCSSEMKLIEILAPVKMDEKVIIKALDSLNRASGDAQMSDLIKAGYFAQKALKAYEANMPDEAEAAANKARSILGDYSCDNGWKFTGTIRDRIAQAILNFLEELKAKSGKAEEAPKVEPAPQKPQKPAFVPSLENCAKRSQEYNAEKNKCAPCGDGKVFSKTSKKCENKPAKINCDVSPNQMMKMKPDVKEAFDKACKKTK